MANTVASRVFLSLIMPQTHILKFTYSDQRDENAQTCLGEKGGKCAGEGQRCPE